MGNTIEVSFPGGARVDAIIKDKLIKTDQSVKYGGEGSEPEPFEHFISSIATCAGIFALKFCQSREISTEGMSLSMECETDKVKKLYGKIAINLTLPEGFPEKYKEAIIR
ncbi:MAG: osmotically inducible protein OsmC, partial [Deltaproteobacteria bacterium]|nr:osmotically inducible protein OsmC [Deltaproteobacteria bacterium]